MRRRRGGVALEEDLVPTAGVVFSAEEVVQPDFIQGCHGSVGGDVPPDGDLWSLSAGDQDCGVPPHPGTVFAFHDLVTGEVGFLVDTDGVDVGGVD